MGSQHRRADRGSVPVFSARAGARHRPLTDPPPSGPRRRVRRRHRRRRTRGIGRGFAPALAIAGAVVAGIAAQQWLVPMLVSSHEPEPAATLSVPATLPIGSTFGFSVTFDNLNATHTGYGPYVDVFMPVQGADGDPDAVPPDDGEPDGASLVGGSVTYLGTSVRVIDVPLVCDGSDAHPFTGQVIDCDALAHGDPDSPITPRKGDVLHVLELPFGSFTPTQPAVTVDLQAQLSELADIDAPLTILARGGFRFGDTATGANGPIVQADLDQATVTPTVLELSKAFSGPENETATGPNYPRTWTVRADVAEGQTVTDLTITDTLPPEVVFDAVDVTAPVGHTIAAQPAVGQPVAAGDDELVVVLDAPVTGTAGTDVTVTITFHVPETTAAGTHVLDPSTGASVQVANEAAASANWDPIDDRDDPVAFDDVTAEQTFTARSLAIQKSLENLSGSDSAPGDVLEWALEFQVSDFFAFDDLAIADVLTDGQSLVGGHPIELTFDDATHGTLTIDAAPHTTVVVDGDDTACGVADPQGSISVDIALSDAIAAARDADGDVATTGGVLTGGRHDGANEGATTGTITFRTRIDANYRCLDGGQAVDSRDVIGNTVTIAGDVVSGTGRPTDGSSASTAIVSPGLSKTVYARNGDTSDTGPQFTAGDTITYRLTATLPITNFEDLVVTDFLPLPVLHATDLLDGGGVPNVDFTAPSASPPPAGTVSLGPDDTVTPDPAVGLGVEPTVTVDETGNSIAFDYGTYQDAAATGSATIDLLVSLEIRDDPFADGLFLTNQLRLQYGDSFEEVSADDEIVQFELTAPVLELTKGAVATDGPGVFAPATVGPGTPWSLTPDGDGRRWDAGTVVSSSALDTSPVDSDLTGVHAGDLVAFALVVENTGAGLNGAFDVTVTDTMPDGLVVPSGGIALQVTDGAGTAIGHAGDLFAGGLTLDDDTVADPPQGAIAPFDDSSGANVAVITYVLEVDADVDMGQVIVNDAAVTGYAAAPGADAYAPVEDRTATVTVALPSLAKSITATSAGHTTGNDVAIGEVVTYEVVVSVPPSATEVVLRDELDAGLAISALTSLVASAPTLTSSHFTGPAIDDFDDILADGVLTTVSSGGRIASIDLGTLTNSGENVETLTLTFDAAVTNVTANRAGTDLVNRAELLRDAGASRLGDQAVSSAVTVVEPAMTVTKTVDDATPDADDTVTYTITVTNTSTVDAFDVALVDQLPDGLTYEPGSLTHDTGPAPDTGPSHDSGDFMAGWNTFPAGQTSTFSYAATVTSGAVGASDGGVITNTAGLTWTSLPGTDPSTSDHTDLAIQRTGDPADPGEVNDYADTDDATINVASSAVGKWLTATSAAHTTGANVTIGEIATFWLKVTLPEGDLGVVTVTDALPSGLAYVTDTLEVCETAADCDGAGMDAEGLDADFDGTLGTPQVTGGVGDDLAITFDGNLGDGSGSGVVVTASGDTQQASSFVITYDAVVRDLATTTHGDTLTNTATVTVADTTSDPASTTLDVVESSLDATKDFVVVVPHGLDGYTAGDWSFVTSPQHAAANDTVEITIGVTNTSGLTAFDVAVTDQLDPGVFTAVAVTSVEAGWTDGSTVGAGQLAFSIAELADGASATFTVSATVRGDVAGQLDPTSLPHGHDNTATVAWASLAAADDAQDERRDADSAPAVAYTADGVGTLQLTAPDLVVTKTGSSTITPGGTATYTITVTNEGGRRADGIELTDRLPEDDRVAFDDTQLGLPDPDIAYDAAAGANGTITWQLGSLDPGQQVTRTVEIGLVDPVVAGSDGDVVTNLATADDDGSWGDDLNPDDNDDTHGVTIDSTVALVVDKVRTSPVGPVGTQGTVVYELTVTNTGNEHVEGAVVTDELADHTSFVSATPARDEDASSATEVIWPAFDLEAVAQGEPPNTAVFTLTVEVDATVPSGVDALTNTARVAFDGDEHTDTDTVVLDAAPEFAVDKTTTEVDRGDGAGFQPADGLIHAGDVVRYTITVANIGDQGATGVTMTDTLADEVTFVGQACADAPAHTVTSTAGQVTWTFTQEFDAGDGFTCTLDVAVDDPLDTLPGGPTHLVNTVEVTDDGSDNSGVPVTADDDTTDRLNTTGVTKTLVGTSAGHTAGADVVIGEVVTYRIVIDLPEGELGEVVVRDHLAVNGLDYVDGSVTICDVAACDALAGDFSGTLDPVPPTVSGGTGGSPLLFTFADVEVDDIQLDGSGDPISNRFTITYDAVVTDVASNESATTLTNMVDITVDGAQFDAPDGVTVTVVEPALELAKSFAFPDAHLDDAPGAATTDTVTVELTVTNPAATSEATAFTIEVVDLLDAALFGEPTDIVAGGWSTAVTSIDGGDTWQLTVEGASLAVGASHTITFDVEVAAGVPVGDIIGNDASASFTSLPGGDGRSYDPVDASDTFTVIGPDVDVDKTTAATTVEPGDPVTYTIEVTNTGSRQADELTIVDELPDELVYVASSGGFTTVDYDADAHIVTWTVANLAAGASADWQLEVTVVDPVPSGAPPITNTAAATYDGDRRADVASADDSATISLDAFVDLVLDKQASAADIVPGGTVTYTLSVTNRGDENADDVELTDTLPAHTTFVSASNGGAETGGVVSWPAFSVAGSDTQTVERTVTVRLDGTVPAGLDGIVNDAEVTHDDDVDTSNNTATAAVDVDAAPELTVTKDDGRTVALVGDTHAFTIVVANVGDQGATGVTVVDTLPDGYSYASSSPAGTHVAGVITWNLGAELAAGDDVTLELTVTVDDPLPTGTTSLTNTVAVTDDGANSAQPTTDSDTDTNTAGTDLNVTIELIEDLVPGATGTYRITVGNAGPEDVDALTLTTSLDSALSNRTFDPDVGSYNPSTHVWSGVGLDVGDEITMTMTVDVALSASGTLTAGVTVDPIGHAELDDDDNTDTTSDGLSPKVELELTKVVDGQPARGGQFDYVLTVTNHGPSRATGVRITDTFPAGITPIASSGSGWSCTLDGQTVTCVQAAAVGPDTTSTLRLTARVGANVEGQVTNTASVTAADAEVTGADRTGTATFVLGAATGRTGSVALTGLQVAGLLAGGLALTGAGTMVVGSVLRRRRT